MYKGIIMNAVNNTELNVHHCGAEDCAPGHSYGPAVRDHFLIHYILGGKGYFQVGKTTYHLKKGQGFLICPDVITYYQADFNEPWQYAWVGFQGLKAELYLKQAGLSDKNPIFLYEKDDYLKNCLFDMISASNLTNGRDTHILGTLYLFLSQLIETVDHNFTEDDSIDRKEQYIRKAVEYMNMNYSRKISINDISRHIGIDRKYMSFIFKNYINISPQEFLINFRMEKACELMGNNCLTIGDISRSVGYEDQLLFSKIFKKIKGASPKEYRKNRMPVSANTSMK